MDGAMQRRSVTVGDGRGEGCQFCAGLSQPPVCFLTVSDDAATARVGRCPINHLQNHAYSIRRKTVT